MITFEYVQEANRARGKAWHGDAAEWTMSDWGVALGGEVGEALNIIKKLNRERDGLVGNNKSKAELEEALGKELADIVHYSMIIANVLGIDLGKTVAAKFNEISIRNNLPHRI
jgi:NTP pyrophosphatase (non-canonical NTP hydrolase)